jgi:hypothetical protein
MLMPTFLLALGAALHTDGDVALRSMLARYGKLRNVEISISKSGRDRRSDAFSPGISGLIAYQSPNRFRYEQSEYWGGGYSYISDGSTLKVMPADYGSIRLRKTGATIMSSHPALSPGSGSFAMVLLFLEGPAAYDKLVAAKTPVTVAGQRLEFKSKDFGKVTIFLAEGLASEILFDNKPNRMASYRMVPMFGDPPEDPMEVEALSYRLGVRFPSRTFDTSVKKGDDFIDERKLPKE